MAPGRGRSADRWHPERAPAGPRPTGRDHDGRHGPPQASGGATGRVPSAGPNVASLSVPVGENKALRVGLVRLQLELVHFEQGLVKNCGLQRNIKSGLTAALVFAEGWQT